MANEVQLPNFLANKSAYFLIRNNIGQIWNGSAFVAYATANYALYTVSLTEQGTASGFYAGTFPSAIAPGVYGIVAKQQISGAAAETDPGVGAGDFQWNGTAIVPLSDLATSGQIGQVAPIRLARGSMISNFRFKLVSSTDHISAFTSGVVSGQIARDGGAFGALQSGAFSELGLGHYAVQSLTSGDLLANTASLVFTANGISGGTADQRDFVLVLQRTSGQ